MFERFTKGARLTAIGARERALALGHPVVGTEHILLALLDHDPDGPAGRALHGAGITTDVVLAGIHRHLATPDRPAFDAEDAAALGAVGIDLDAVRAMVEEHFGPGALDEPPARRAESAPRLMSWLLGRDRDDEPHPSGHIRFGPRAKKVLELSLREAIRLKEREITTRHILLGLIREGEGLAALILVQHGVDLETLRRTVEDHRDEAA